MSIPNPLSLLILVAALIITLAVAVMVILSHRSLQAAYRRTVAETSRRCAALEQLNSKFIFREFTPIAKYRVRLDSQQQYDAFQLDELFLDALHRDRDSIQQCLRLAAENLSCQREYAQHLKNLPAPATAEFAQDQGVPGRIYRRYETERFKSLLRRPVCQYFIDCSKHCAHPRHSQQKRYAIADIQRGYQELERRARYQHTVPQTASTEHPQRR